MNEPSIHDIAARTRTMGHCCVDFVDDEALTELQAACRDIIRRDLGIAPQDLDFFQKHHTGNKTYVNPHLHSDVLARWVTSTAVRELMTRLLGKFALQVTLLQRTQAGSGQGIPWHQDIEPSLGPQRYYNLIIYPFGTAADAGGIKVVAGSHLHRRLPPGDPFGSLVGEALLVPGPGSLLIMDGCTFHCVPRNERSGQDRVSFVMKFCRADVQHDPRLSIGVYRTGKFDYKAGHDVDDTITA